jgi:hypothetical protein
MSSWVVRSSGSATKVPIVTVELLGNDVQDHDVRVMFEFRYDESNR